MADNLNFRETGDVGLSVMAGYIQEAYSRELYWPACAELFENMYQSDPEIQIAKTVLQAYATRAKVQFVVDTENENPGADDKKAVDFGNEVLEDLEHDMQLWLPDAMSRTLLFGWGWYEVPLGVRSKNWVSPNGDGWKSSYDDNLIGFRKFAYRRHRSFLRWELDEKYGWVNGLWQTGMDWTEKYIPKNNSLHLTFGDLYNPEGIGVMTPLWRLNRIKYALEIVHGIGAEHAAGYLNVHVGRTLSPDDKDIVKKAAKAILTAQQGNYALWPEGIEGKVEDVTFTASASILDAIRYYGMLKLGLLMMQWAALGTMSPFGSYSTMTDATELFLVWFNSVTKAVIQQVDQQIGRRLFDIPVNRAAFPGMKKRPVLEVSQVTKPIDLKDMGAFLTAISMIMPLSTEDYIQIRSASGGILVKNPPESTLVDIRDPWKSGDGEEKRGEQDTEEEDKEEEDTEEEGEEEEKEDAEDKKEMAIVRPFVPSPGEAPTETYPTEPWVVEKDIKRAVRKFQEWAEENEPDVAKILRAKVVEQ